MLNKQTAGVLKTGVKGAALAGTLLVPGLGEVVGLTGLASLAVSAVGGLAVDHVASKAADGISHQIDQHTTGNAQTRKHQEAMHLYTGEIDNLSKTPTIQVQRQTQYEGLGPGAAVDPLFM